MNSKELFEVLHYCGYNPCSYSGRGMYGKKCIGFVTKGNSSLFNLAFELAAEMYEFYCDESDVFKLLENFSKLVVETDSIGDNTIVYFPSMELVENEDEDEN